MSGNGFDVGRAARTLVLIAFVTAVFLLLASSRLSGQAFRAGVGGIATVAFLTAIVAFLIAAGSAYDEPRSS